MMQRLWIVSGLMTALCLFAGGYWAGQGQVREVTVEKVVYSDRVVREMSQAREDKLTVTERTTTKPNGEVIREKVAEVQKNVTTASKIEQESSLEATKASQAKSHSNDYQLAIYLPPRWPVQDYRNIRLQVSRRLLGPVSVGVQVSLAGEVLVGLGVAF